MNAVEATVKYRRIEVPAWRKRGGTLVKEEAFLSFSQRDEAVTWGTFSTCQSARAARPRTACRGRGTRPRRKSTATGRAPDLSLSALAWAKLNNWTHAQAIRADKPTSASEVAAVLLEQLVSGQQ